MTALEQIWALIKKLRKLSATGKIDWERGVEDGLYQVSFPQYTVSISKSAGYRESEESYHIQIKNAEGEVIDEVHDEMITQSIEGLMPGEAFRTLEALFSMSRSRAHGIDSALSSLMTSLDALDENKGAGPERLSDPKSTKSSSPFDSGITDDDVPF